MYKLQRAPSGKDHNQEWLTGMELLRPGERVRKVFLNPSKKFSLLFVGLGVRGCA